MNKNQYLINLFMVLTTGIFTYYTIKYNNNVVNDQENKEKSIKNDNKLVKYDNNYPSRYICLSTPSSILFNQRPFIITFGDSITQYGYQYEERGWVSQLSSYYIRKIDVINRGFSGYNTDYAKLMLNSLFPNIQNNQNFQKLKNKNNDKLDNKNDFNDIYNDDNKNINELMTKTIELNYNNEIYYINYHKPLLITIFFGANDASHEGFPQHVSLDDYQNNLNYIIDHIENVYGKYENGKGPAIIMITPPPLWDSAWEEHCCAKDRILDRTNKTTKLYANACINVANNRNIPVIDLHTILTQDGKEYAHHGNQNNPHEHNGYRVFLKDGLHFSSKGNTRMFQLLIETIRKYYPYLLEENLPCDYPDWSEIDPNNPEGDFLQKL